MINANELRIGNFVLCDGKCVKMLTIGIEDMRFIFSDSCQPIPITRDLIEDKCGFETFPWGYVKKAREDFGVRLNIKTFSYDVSGNSPVKLKYLHQLQNLYYSLTGEELDIKIT